MVKTCLLKLSEQCGRHKFTLAKLGVIYKIVVITEFVEIQVQRPTLVAKKKKNVPLTLNDNRSHKNEFKAELLGSRLIVITSQVQVQKKSKQLSTSAFIYCSLLDTPCDDYAG